MVAFSTAIESSEQNVLDKFPRAIYNTFLAMVNSHANQMWNAECGIAGQVFQIVQSNCLEILLFCGKTMYELSLIHI